MAQEWKQTRLAEVCNFQNGFAFKNSDYVEEGDGAIEIFRMGNILRGGGFNPDGKKVLVAHEQAQKLGRFLLNEGDILICMTDMKSSMALLGHTARMPVSGRYLVNQRVGRITVKKPDLLDQRFLYYYSNSPDYIDWLRSHANSGVQVNLSTEAILNSPIPLPPLPVQRRVAGILSAYNELIENSQRRIRILDEMARALYREWFVHFRFPGHEKLPRVASTLGDIPKGWEVATLGVQLAALESGKRPKGGIQDVEDGVPSIGAENINGIGRHDFSSEKFIPREFFQEMLKGVVRDGDVAIYKDGAYIGKSSYFRDGFPHSECCVNEHVFLLRANGVRLTQNALYLWLQEPNTVHAIRATNANAAQPGINQQSVGGLELILPDEKTATRFERLVEPLFGELINLAKRIQNLRRTRDLLLPRLLSGQVSLS